MVRFKIEHAYVSYVEGAFRTAGAPLSNKNGIYTSGLPIMDAAGILARSYCEMMEAEDGIPRVTQEEFSDQAFMARLRHKSRKLAFAVAGKTMDILEKMEVIFL